MEKVVEFDKRLPIYQQGIAWMKQRIVAGTWHPGSELPSRRELAVVLNINPNTAQRIFKTLEEEDLIQTSRNAKSNVTRDKELIALVRKRMTREALEECVEQLKLLGNSAEDIKRILVQFAKAIEKEGNDA